MEKIGYLGPEGSYSFIAAEKLFPQGEKVPYISFRLLMNALGNGECDRIVLPVENSLNGGVNQNLDLLQNAEGIVAYKSCTVKIDHRLATLAGADPSKIERIYSHQQALEQCGEFLFKNYPKAKLAATQSTSASLEMIKTPFDAGIVGAHVKRENIVLSEENIADEKNNVTYFLLLKRGDYTCAESSEKIFFTATCLHKPKALCELLLHLGESGLNMTKIQSRPIKDKPGEYRFFIEVEADFADGKVKRVLKELKESANSFKILGIY